MAMDTVTGRRSDGRPAWGRGRRGGVSRREADQHEVDQHEVDQHEADQHEVDLREAVPRGGVGDARSGGPSTVAPRRRPAVRSGARRGPAVCAGSHAPDLHGSRLTPRGRVVVALVWLAMAAIAMLMVATVPGDGAQGPATMTTKVMIEPGGTLWQLAGEVQPGADRHETVAVIMSLNDLESASQIRPGDILVVPVEP